MKMRGFKLFAAVLTATMLSVTAAIPAAAYPNTAGHWTQNGGKWYFLDEQGNTVYGWIYDNNSWYYFSPRWGPCTATGWSFGTEDSTTSARSMTGALGKC